MIDFLKQPFHLLDRRQNRILLVIVIGIYVILFMNLYLPFNVDRWYGHASIPLFVILSSFGIIGMVVLAISQLVIREVLNIRTVKVYAMVLWFLVELILLTLTMYFIYGDLSLSDSDRIHEVLLTLRYTLLVIIIPYAGVLFYLFTTQKGESVDRLMTASNHLVNLMDENGELHLAIDLENLLFLRSADNYVAVYFKKDDKVKKELVRTTLKRLETELDEFPIRRCHRSYMVNIKNISISMKSQKGLTLAIRDYPEETLPVSKNYKPFFIRLLKEK